MRGTSYLELKNYFNQIVEKSEFLEDFIGYFSRTKSRVPEEFSFRAWRFLTTILGLKGSRWRLHQRCEI